RRTRDNGVSVGEPWPWIASEREPWRAGHFFLSTPYIVVRPASSASRSWDPSAQRNRNRLPCFLQTRHAAEGSARIQPGSNCAMERDEGNQASPRIFRDVQLLMSVSRGSNRGPATKTIKAFRRATLKPLVFPGENGARVVRLPRLSLHGRERRQGRVLAAPCLLLRVIRGPWPTMSSG